MLIGLASIAPCDDRRDVLKGMMTDQLRRAVLAFPDEDVLIGTRMVSPSGFEAYATLADIVPRPGHKASGEERAWGRRLAKRFGIDAGLYNDRTFIARCDGNGQCMFDYAAPKGAKVDAHVVALFDDVAVDSGDVLIAFGWAMAEDLDALLNSGG